MFYDRPRLNAAVVSHHFGVGNISPIRLSEIKNKYTKIEPSFVFK